MKLKNPHFRAPSDANQRKTIPPVICYSPDTLPQPDLDALSALRQQASKTAEVTAAPRDAACIDVPAGAFVRVVSVDGPQVGDLNLRPLTAALTASMLMPLMGSGGVNMVSAPHVARERGVQIAETRKDAQGALREVAPKHHQHGFAQPIRFQPTTLRAE